MEQLAEVFSNTSLVAEAIAEADVAERQRAKDIERRAGTIRQELTATRRGLDRYFAAFGGGSLSPRTAASASLTSRARIDALEVQAASLAQERADKTSEPLTAAEIKG